jgi:hypothetical protein
MTLLGNRKCFCSNYLCAHKARLRTCEPSSAPVENIRQITPIVQNKPKVKSPRIYLNACKTSTYAQMDNWLNAKNKPNQTQFKANSNPMPKMLINPYIRALYTQKPPCSGQKNKPKTNPIAKMDISMYYTILYNKKPPSGRTKKNPIQTQLSVNKARSCSRSSKM